MRKAACLLVVVAVVILANWQGIQQAYRGLAPQAPERVADAPSSTPQPTQPPAIAAGDTITIASFNIQDGVALKCSADGGTNLICGSKLGNVPTD